MTAGLLAATMTLLAYEALDFEINFSLEARDMPLLYFFTGIFTGIGLNARLDDLVSGGRPLILLLALTLAYLIIQTLIAAASVVALGLPKGLRRLRIAHRRAWNHDCLGADHHRALGGSPMRSKSESRPRTLGLAVASLVGGPIAGLLIARHKLAGPATPGPVVGLPDDPGDKPVDDLSHTRLLRTAPKGGPCALRLRVNRMGRGAVPPRSCEPIYVYTRIDVVGRAA